MNVCLHLVALMLQKTAQISKDPTNAQYVRRDICGTKEDVWVCTKRQLYWKHYYMFACGAYRHIGE